MKKIIRLAMVFALACGTLLYTGCTKDFSQDVEGVNAQVVELQNTVRALSSTVSALETFKTQALEQLAKKANQSDLDAANGNIADLQDAIRTLNAAQGSLTTAINTAKKEAIDEAKEYVDTQVRDAFNQATSAVNNLNDIVSGLAGRVSALEDAYADAFSGATASLSGLESAIEELTGRVNNIADRIQSLSYVPASMYYGYNAIPWTLVTIDNDPSSPLYGEGGRKPIIPVTFKVTPEKYAAQLTVDDLVANFVADPTRAWIDAPVPGSKVSIVDASAETGYIDLLIIGPDSLSFPSLYGEYDATWDEWDYDELPLLSLVINNNKTDGTNIASDYILLVNDSDSYAASLIDLIDIYDFEEDESVSFPTPNGPAYAFDPLLIPFDDHNTYALFDGDIDFVFDLGEFGILSVDEVVDIFDLDEDLFSFGLDVNFNRYGDDFDNSEYGVFVIDEDATEIPVDIAVAESDTASKFVGSVAEATWSLSVNDEVVAEFYQPAIIIYSLGEIFNVEEIEVPWNINTWNAAWGGYNQDGLKVYNHAGGVGDLTPIAAELDDQDDKLYTDALYLMTGDDWAAFEEAFYTNDTEAMGAAMTNAVPLSYGNDFHYLWDTKNSVEVNFPQIPAREEDDVTYVYVAEYILNNNKMYYIATPITIKAAPGEVNVTLDGDLFASRDSIRVSADAVEKVIADVKSALTSGIADADMPTDDEIAVDFFAWVGPNVSVDWVDDDNIVIEVSDTTGETAFFIREDGVNTIEAFVPGAPAYEDDVEVVLDTVYVWDVPFIITIQGNVGPAPEFVFDMISDPRITITGPNTADVFAALTDAGVPEQVNLNQLLRISQNGESAIISQEDVEVVFYVKEDAPAAMLYDDITIDGVDTLTVTSFTDIAGNAYATLDDNGAVLWNNCIAQKFTVVAVLLVEGVEVDNVELTIYTEDPVAAADFAGYNWVVDASNATVDITVSSAYDSLTVVANTTNLVDTSLVVFGAAGTNADDGTAIAGIYSALGDALGAQITLAESDTWYYNGDPANLLANNPTNFAIDGNAVDVTLKAGNTLTTDVVVTIPITLTYKYMTDPSTPLESAITITFKK